jgi:hypothetical protein
MQAFSTKCTVFSSGHPLNNLSRPTKLAVFRPSGDYTVDPQYRVAVTTEGVAIPGSGS